MWSIFSFINYFSIILTKDVFSPLLFSKHQPNTIPASTHAPSFSSTLHGFVSGAQHMPQPDVTSSALSSSDLRA